LSGCDCLEVVSAVTNAGYAASNQVICVNAVFSRIVDIVSVLYRDVTSVGLWHVYVTCTATWRQLGYDMCTW